MKRTLILFMGGILLILLAACGPSPEQISTMTASAWTATPKPTATATPVPYDLTVSVVDGAGAPISGASITFPESGNGEPILADQEGKYSLTNLPGENVSLTVAAQGYLDGQSGAKLERGPNEVTVVLERDPFGILPAEACASGENLLFLEDFQDGKSELNHYLNGQAPLPLGASPDETGNMVLIHDSSQLPTNTDWSTYTPFGELYTYGDAVWRMRFMISKEMPWDLFWNAAGPNEFGGVTLSNSGYGIAFNEFRHLNISRNISDASGKQIGKPFLGDVIFIQKPGLWHYLEISTFQGQMQVWVDGNKVIEVQDDNPLPPGGFTIQGARQAGVQYFDAITVCGLSAPFTSIQPPVPVQ
jgi:hypothetical protein